MNPGFSEHHWFPSTPPQPASHPGKDPDQTQSLEISSPPGFAYVRAPFLSGLHVHFLESGLFREPEAHVMGMHPTPGCGLGFSYFLQSSGPMQIGLRRGTLWHIYLQMWMSSVQAQVPEHSMSWGRLDCWEQETSRGEASWLCKSSWRTTLYARIYSKLPAYPWGSGSHFGNRSNRTCKV